MPVIRYFPNFQTIPTECDPAYDISSHQLQMLIIFWFSINLFRLIDLWLMMHKFWRFGFKSTQFFAFTRPRISNLTKETYKRSSLWYKRQFISCNLSRNCLRGGENKLHGTRLLGALTSPETGIHHAVSRNVGVGRS